MTGKEFVRSIGNGVLRSLGRVASRLDEESPMEVDVLESDEEYLVVFDAPGVRASDVQVRYLGGEVLVRMDRFRDHREPFEMRFPGRALELDGRARLPEDAAVEADRATARLRDDGTLYVFLPKEGDGGESVPVSERAEASAVGSDAAASSAAEVSVGTDADADVGVDGSDEEDRGRDAPGGRREGRASEETPEFDER